MEDRTEIEGVQLERLGELVRKLVPANAFYRDRISAAGLEEITTLEDFRERMPFTTKAELWLDHESHPPYGSNLTEPLERYPRYCQSSGTAGGPMAWLDTEESWSAMLDCWDRVYDAAGVSAGDSIFFAFSFGPFLGFWTAFDAAVRRGCLCVPGGGLSSVARLELLQARQCRVLCCTPTYALRLGEVMRRELGATPDQFGVRLIIVAGEPGGSIPETRAKIEESWKGARVFDHHGMTEVGPVSYEHAGPPAGLAVIEEAYLAEVIDPATGREVGDGGTGELVLTTLVRAACPLLRYRTGDLVKKAYARDGEGPARLILEGGILGRSDDMVVVRGVNVYPAAVEQVIRAFPEVAEYQVLLSTRDSMAELEVVVEPGEAGGGGELAERVAHALENAFTLRIPVSLAASGALPRFEFKSKRWVRKE